MKKRVCDVGSEKYPAIAVAGQSVAVNPEGRNGYFTIAGFLKRCREMRIRDFTYFR